MPNPEEPPSSPLPSLLLLGAIAQVATTLPTFAAPYIAKAFELSDQRLALVSGVISLGAFGAFLLGRLADRHGRRPVLRAGFVALAPLSLLTAFAPGIELYIAAQLVVCALRGALSSVVSVSITEVSTDAARAGNHAYYGFVIALASGLPLVLAAALGERSDGWRWLFGIVGSTVVLLPWIWRAVPETGRFERLRDDPSTKHARFRELFEPAYRRLAVGLVVVGVLRGAAIGAIGFYAFHHAVANVGLSAAEAAGVFGASAAVGVFGNFAGAVLAERWGRRPTQVVGALIATTSGVAYYWVPTHLGIYTQLGLGFTFFGFVFGGLAFSVADRLVDTELFPTRLRATYAGMRMLGEAAARVLQNLGLAAAISVLGSIERALLVFVPLLVAPSLVLFWWVTSEPRGRGLDEADL